MEAEEPILLDMGKYPGEWILMDEGKVIAHNKDLSKLSKFEKKCKGIPAIAWVPDGEYLPSCWEP